MVGIKMTSDDYIKPLVSIITPSYNGEKYISKTIESVINQTYKNWEMIIVDDLSTDKTEHIVKSYQKNDKRIKFFKLEKKGGASVARNKAIEKSKGKYIAFLDSDDLWKKDKLEKQINFMEENKIYFSYTDYEYIDKNGNLLYKKFVSPKKICYFRMLLGNSIGCLTVIYNQEKLGKENIPYLRKRNDYALWCRLLKKSKVGYKYNDVLSYYRKNENSISSGSKFGLIKYHFQMHREVNDFNIVISTVLTMCNIINYGFNRFLRLKKMNKTDYKATIVGHFCSSKNNIGGQTIKTESIYNELIKIYNKKIRKYYNSNST